MIPRTIDFLIFERKFETLVHVTTVESRNILSQDLVENTYCEGVKEAQKRDTILSIYSEFESIISRTMINRSCCNRCILLFLSTVTQTVTRLYFIIPFFFNSGLKLPCVPYQQFKIQSA